MKCQKIINAATIKMYNLCGYRTHKQNSEMAVTIGKELVDACKEQPLTENLLISSVKKYYPDLNLKIILGAEKLVDYLRTGHWPEEMIKAQTKVGGTFFYSKPFKRNYTIFLNDLPYLTELSKIKIFSHEFNHLEDFDFTPSYTKRKLKYLWKKSSIRKFLNKKRKYKHQTEEPKSILVHKNLINFFGLKKMAEKHQNFFPNTSNTLDSILNFFSSDKYIGLNSSKRLDAYIRAILRHEVNPKNKDSVKELKLVKSMLKDEFRAYKTSDAVERYATGNYENISLIGLTVDVMNRAIKIINKEINTARKEAFLRFIGLRPNKVYNTGLPSEAYFVK